MTAAPAAAAVVVCVGIATIDDIFGVGALPSGGGKFVADRHERVTGGIAANAALAVARLGGAARLVGRVGDDAAGRAIRAAMAAGGVDAAGLAAIPGAATPVSAVMIDEAGERMVVNRRDPALFAGPAAIAPDRLAGMGAVMADTRWPAGAEAALLRARAAGAPGLLDYDTAPGAPADGLLAAASHVVFSAPALAALAGDDDPEAGLRWAAARAPAARLAVTAGPRGAFYLQHGEVRHAPAFVVAAVDTLGAGDALHGAAALALAEGRSFGEALRFGAAAAAVAVSRRSGPDRFPTRAEADALMRTRA